MESMAVDPKSERWVPEFEWKQFLDIFKIEENGGG